MKLRPEDVQRLETFLDEAAGTIQPEPPSPLHAEVTARVWKSVAERCALPAAARVLDLGCGQGLALRHFRDAGLEAIGVTLSATDAEACRGMGFEVRILDQSFLDFPDAHFDLAWCRHCLEHSVFPLFTLRGVRRVLRPGGWVYAEVPAPDTAARHQTNPNHYSVLGRSAWAELLGRAGLRVENSVEIAFPLISGPDLYWGFLARAAP